MATAASRLGAAPLDRALEAYRHGHYALAAQIAAELGRQAPAELTAIQMQAVALNAHGVQLAAAGRWTEALAPLRQASDLRPEDRVIASNFHRAAIHTAEEMARRHGRFAEALALLQEIAPGVEADLDAGLRSLACQVELAWARDPAAGWAEHERRQHLEAALDWQPDSAPALVALGRWHYARDEYEAAAALWRRALEIDPTLPHIGPLLAQIAREERITADYIAFPAAHFRVRHAPEISPAYVASCLRVLDQTFALVSEELQWAPSDRIPLVISPEDDFLDVTHAPQWALAAFDGKLRVVARPLRSHAERRALQDTLSHELMHAFIFDLAETRCPSWLSEGLAQNAEWNFEIDPVEAALLRRWKAQGRLVPITDLPVEFGEIAATEDAQRAYLQAASFTQMLLRRFGAPRLRRVIEDLGREVAVEEAVAARLGVALVDLDRQWREGL